MGLAASQARFLAITARKMNCEFESMQIAQQKLSVTREQQKAAQEYQDAMTATKLVWDADNNCDGTGNVYNLSYDLMMTPSALNEYDAFLVTDTQGRVVLSESMFGAAVKAGVVDSAGNPIKAGQYSEEGRNKFLEALGETGTIDGSVISGIKSLKNSYTQVGVGGEISDKKIANAMNSPTFINHLKTAVYKKDDTNNNILSLSGSIGYPVVQAYAENGKAAGTILKSAGETYSGNVVKTTFKAGDTINFPINGYKVSSETIAEAPWVSTDGKGEAAGKPIPAGTSLKIEAGTKAPCDITVYVPTNSTRHNEGDLKYAMSFGAISDPAKNVVSDPKTTGKTRITKNGQALSADSMKKLTLGDILSGKCEFTTVAASDGDFSTLANGVLEEMAKLLGYNAGATEFKGLNVDNESNDALKQALELTKAQLQSINKEDGSYFDLATKSQSRNDVVKDGTTYSFSLTNILKSFLTNYAAVMDGFKVDYTVDTKSTKKSVYVTDDLNYTFLVENDSAETDTATLNADFYNQLYNALCMYGASTDKIKQQQIQDSNYLNNALKNGQLFVMSLNTDGYFYQGHYTASDHIAEISDDEAIAQAEAEYNIKKSKLSYKEQNLELKMKNIDTELSSLNTEYDTVKNLISKNVEKVFTMFST